MPITRPLQILTVAGVLSAGLGVAAAQLAPASASVSAPAIPARQAACNAPFLSLTGGTGQYHSMGVRVSVNNGSASRVVVAFASLDADVSVNAEMRLSWSVDGHAVSDYTYGPGNIAENQQFWGTRTVMNLIPLGPGIHTLTPEVRLSGNSATSGVVSRLCVAAEAHTS
jgi:hypothetical protein